MELTGLAGSTLTEADVSVEWIEAQFQAVLSEGFGRGFEVPEYGEVASELRLHFDSRRYDVKRLPPFSNRESSDNYVAQVLTYASHLRGRGVNLRPTTVVRRTLPRGARVVYHVLPVREGEVPLRERLANANEEEALRLFESILTHVDRVIDPRLGIDAQVHNWTFFDDALWFGDVLSPMMRDSEDRVVLDRNIYVAGLPPWLRWIVVRFVLGDILRSFHDRRLMLTDILSCVRRDGLSKFLEPFRERVNRTLEKPISREELDRFFASERRMARVVYWLRRVDRLWRKGVLRRPYHFILPPSVDQAY